MKFSGLVKHYTGNNLEHFADVPNHGFSGEYVYIVCVCWGGGGGGGGGPNKVFRVLLNKFYRFHILFLFKPENML